MKKRWGCRECRGDHTNTDYMAWHEDSERRSRLGQKQSACPQCGRWEWNAYIKPLDTAPPEETS